VIYIEQKPCPPLDRFIRTLWYARAPAPRHGRERILPTGCVQVILNLARDFLMDCREGQPPARSSPSLVVGARSIYEIVDTSDMADLIGIVFEPGGFPVFAADAADRFSNCSVALDDLWGRQVNDWRDRLREIASPAARLRCFESFLMGTFAARLVTRNRGRDSVLTFALGRFARVPSITTVREVAHSVGWSERHFSQVFREEVGLSPKVWCRIQRFQRAVRQLHAEADVTWAELALDWGFYDQSHFANEFRAFSGIDATTYSARRTIWANHVPLG
jgi:AraC-like DNA-binding protein